MCTREEFDAEKQKVLGLFQATANDSVSEFEAKIQSRAQELYDTVDHVLETTLDAYGVTLLHAAVNHANLQVAKWLLASPMAPILAAPIKTGDTLLHSAVSSSDIEVIKLAYEYLETKSEVSPMLVMNLKKVTPAQMVVEGDLTAVLDWMVTSVPYRGGPKDAEQVTPLQTAVFAQNVGAARKVVSWMSVQGLVDELASSGRPSELPPALVVAGALPDHAAAAEIVEAIVLKAGPGVVSTTVDPDGTNVALNAAEAGNSRLVDFLLDQNPQAFLIENLNKQTAPDVAAHVLHTVIAAKTAGLSRKQTDFICNPHLGTKPEVTNIPESPGPLSAELATVLGVRVGDQVSQPNEGVIQKVEGLKKQANLVFVEDAFQISLELYSQGLQLLQFNGDRYADEKVNHLTAVLLSNVSACFLQQAKPDFAIEAGKMAVKFDENWAKGYMRVAKGYHTQGEPVDAIEWIFKASMKDPGNSTYKQLLAQWSREARTK